MFTQLARRKLPVSYGLMWITIIVVHYAIVKSVYGFSPLIAVTDSLVFNLLFVILGMGLWYMVRFTDLHKKSFLELSFYHLTTITGVMFIWAGLSYILLRQIFSTNEAYLAFLSGSLTIRVFSGILYYVVLVTIYYLVINFRELQEKREKEKGLQILLKEAELNLLRSQIRPHFLFNSLNSISSLTMTDPEKAQEMVIKLSAFMRYSLDTKDNSMSILQQELYHTDLYLDIEKIRFGKRLQVEKQVSEDALNWAMPAMLLQPLIENSVKYGIYESIEANTISLAARVSEGYLIITIGNPFDEASGQHRGTGTGIRNIELRLIHLYGRKDLLKISKTTDYFEIELKIPQYAR
jgi:sensor histidine kinase YesM